MKKDVALVLSSGGPRGIAYIGAIEELIARGYNIHSVAGTSMGSLVGGVFAAGKLAEFKEWITSLDGWSVFSLMDFLASSIEVLAGVSSLSSSFEVMFWRRLARLATMLIISSSFITRTDACALVSASASLR